jgi:hypothetical protein
LAANCGLCEVLQQQRDRSVSEDDVIAATDHGIFKRRNDDPRRATT